MGGREAEGQDYGRTGGREDGRSGRQEDGRHVGRTGFREDGISGRREVGTTGGRKDETAGGREAGTWGGRDVGTVATLSVGVTPRTVVSRERRLSHPTSWPYLSVSRAQPASRSELRPTPPVATPPSLVRFARMPSLLLLVRLRLLRRCFVFRLARGHFALYVPSFARTLEPNQPPCKSPAGTFCPGPIG